MRLVSFLVGHNRRIGAEWDGKLVDFRAAWEGLADGNGQAEAAALFPDDMTAFLETGDIGWEAAKKVTWALQMTPTPPGLRSAIHEPASVKRLAPVPQPRKVICIGLNYRDHCEENNQAIPKSPVIFAKFPTAVTGPGDPIVLPRISEQVDYEAELGVVIGRKGRHIARDRALDYVAGYTVMHDVSARDIQFGDGQWVRGKTFDTFLPMGPALVTPDEVGDPHALAIKCELNGRVLQDSNTRNLIFDVPYLIWFLSQVVTLLPGDCISTGTPAGVGAFRKPPIFMKAGDEVSIEIAKLGRLTNPVVAEA